ncbi:uncharacterized protein E5676_scaffold306G00640 [Cucumis melo var. makuwa]|uniref:Uncharacterized protein n=1 Tax=Cucumis melo var. makuwa TaxID=1194695 RepID=A0A5A7THR9_CUCMM|nr:uncharacterized protein E6C27_scaffold333G00600 [Cucumis melo var. makuwa]TYK17815.1 uncharacterized protein E5676_scaffold306G00640 [Cucumis melo var. makuwa]
MDMAHFVFDTNALIKRVHVDDMRVKVRVAKLPTQYAYHFGDKTKWGAGNIITQDEIHSFATLGSIKSSS